MTVSLWRIAADTPLWTAEDMAGKGAAHKGARWNRPVQASSWPRVADGAAGIISASRGRETIGVALRCVSFRLLSGGHGFGEVVKLLPKSLEPGVRQARFAGHDSLNIGSRAARTLTRRGQRHEHHPFVAATALDRKSVV